MKAFPCALLALSAALGFTSPARAQQDSPQVEQRVQSILSQMTLAEKLDYISGEPLPTNFADLMGVFDIKPIPRLGVPKIIGNDGTLGITAQGLPAGTRYPAGPLLASTWNADRATEEGVAQGREARARGIHEILGPGVDFYRTSFGGRSGEYMTGEDPFLGAVLVAAEVNGMQSQQVMATTKHYACNDQEFNRGPTNDFDPTTLPTMNVQVDERTLREVYLPPYESAVKLGHTAAIMGAFNKVNGDFACQNLFLITNVLRQDWGWLGFIETDFAAEHDGVQAALAGLDIDMPGGSFARMTSATLIPHITGGQAPQIPLSNIDDKVRRILRQIVSFGFLDRPQKDTSIPINDPRSKTTAIDVAREGIVLLKNDLQILPLDKNATPRIAVIGANAQGEPPTAGGSSEVTASSDFTSEIDGIKVQAPNATVDYIAACVPDPATAVWQTGTGTAGLIGQYFNSIDLSGSPVATRVDTELNFTSFNATNVPVANPSSFSGIWTGKVQPTITGDQVFKVSSGGNVRLYVNNQLIIDDTSPVATPDTPISAAPPIIPVSGKIYLQAGVAYDVRLEARNLGGGGTFFANLFRAGGLQVSWASLQPPPTLAGYNAVILAVGANDQYESEGRDRSFGLPEQQDTLIQNVAQVNPRTIVMLHGGGGFDVQPWVDRVPALLHAWFPGQYGGQALGEILFGAVNPSGKLPITMEKRAQDNPAFASFPTDPNASVINYNVSYNSVGNSEGLFIGYRGYQKNHIQPQYPFGYGLSYTTFRYSDLDVDPIVLKQEDQHLTKAHWIEHQGDEEGLIRVSFRITNTGDRAGAEIAQLYVAPVNPPVVRPLKELKGFKKVFLQPGESKKVTITLDRRSLAYYDVSAHAWDVARGIYRILVGSSSQDIELQKAVLNLFSAQLSVLESKPVPVQNAD
jgi:beta-glucosidase